MRPFAGLFAIIILIASCLIEWSPASEAARNWSIPKAEALKTSEPHLTTLVTSPKPVSFLPSLDLEFFELILASHVYQSSAPTALFVASGIYNAPGPDTAYSFSSTNPNWALQDGRINMSGTFGDASASESYRGRLEFSDASFNCPNGCPTTVVRRIGGVAVYVKGNPGTRFLMQYSRTGTVTAAVAADEAACNCVNSIGTSMQSYNISASAQVGQSSTQNRTLTDAIEDATSSRTVQFQGVTYSLARELSSWDFASTSFLGSRHFTGSAEFSATVAVSVKTPPTPIINGSTQGSTNSTITFDGTTSYDPDGTIVAYEWTFEDPSGPVSNSGPVASHSWSTAGTYRITLKTTDNEGLIGTATKTIVVSQCTLPFLSVQPLSQTIPVGHFAILSLVAGTSMPPETLNYQWYEGEKGDTTKPVGNNSPSFLTPSLTQTTKYWARVSDSCGSVDSNTAIITVCSLTINDIPTFTIAPSWSEFHGPITTINPSTQTFSLLVRDGCTQQPISNPTIQFNYQAVTESGGHVHAHPLRPAGFFDRAQGPPQPDGSIIFVYTAPEVSGQIDVSFTVTALDGRTYTSPISQIRVQVDGLAMLPQPQGANYQLVGDKPEHPLNHFGTPSFNEALIRIADRYAALYPGDPLKFNDMSLPLGGLFDCLTCRDSIPWMFPHKGHRFGRNLDLGLVDVRRQTILTVIIGLEHFDIYVEGNHWHLSQRTPSTSNMQTNSKRNVATAIENDVSTISNIVVQTVAQVTRDGSSGLYLYQYSFTNDGNSSSEVNRLQLSLNNSSVSDVVVPQGWMSIVSGDGSLLEFAATDIGPLPPGYVNDGRTLPSPSQIRPGQTLAGFSFKSPYPPSNIRFFAQGYKPLPVLGVDIDDSGDNLSLGGYYSTFNGNTTGPVRDGPILISEATSTRAIVLDSPLWMRDPFPINSPVPWVLDRRTRVMLFAMNFDLLPGEGTSVLSADAEDASHNIYPLTVEYVGKVPGYEWLNCVIIRLNDSMGNVGDVLVRLSVRGVPSNRVRLGVGHNGGGPPDDPGAVSTPGRAP